MKYGLIWRHCGVTDVWNVLQVSMATCALMGRLGQRLQRLRQRPNLPFGGVNMLFCGDFAQFPPPTRYSRALYDSSASAAHDKLTQYGRLLWTSLTHTVVLYQQMRIVDAGWADMLERSRFAACTEADRQLILARRVRRDNPVVWTKETRIVVGRNPLRTLLNFSAAEHAAVGKGTPTLVAVADDARSVNAGTSRKRLNNDHRLAVLDLPDNQTGNLPGKLPLVMGMPCLLRKNVDVPAGLSNGSCGTLVGLVLDPREPPIPSLSMDSAPVHFLKFLPQLLLVRFPSLRRTTPICPDLSPDPHVWPVVLTRESFKYSPTKGVKYTIVRRQFPLIPAYATTAHAAQGLTLQSIVCDLNGCHRLPNAPYVILSRCKDPKRLWVMRDFPLTALQRPPSAELEAEMLRLEQLDDKAVAQYSRHISGLEQEQAEHCYKLGVLRQSGRLLRRETKRKLKERLETLRVTNPAAASQLDPDDCDYVTQTEAGAICLIASGDMDSPTIHAAVVPPVPDESEAGMLSDSKAVVSDSEAGELQQRHGARRWRQRRLAVPWRGVS